MGKNRVKVMILGSEYVILTEDPEQQIQEMASEVESQINSFIESSPGLSSSMATVLAALNFCDGKIKAEQSVDNLREQIKEYLHEAERGRSLSSTAQETAKAAAEEAQRLKSELQTIRKKLNDEAAAVRIQAQRDTEEARAEAEQVRQEMAALKERLVAETQAVTQRAEAEVAAAKAEAGAALKEMEQIKSRMSGGMKDDAEMMETLKKENERLRESQADMSAEMERLRQANFDVEQELEEIRQGDAELQRKIAGETAAIQAQFKKDLKEAKKQVEPLMQEILHLQRQVNLLTERNEEAEREAATLRLALSSQETADEPEDGDEPYPSVPPQTKYFTGDQEVETLDDTESTTDDLLSFFNLRS